MIKAKPATPNFKTVIVNDALETYADVALEKGGQSAGFRPHELLAASLAACISITLRMTAQDKDMVIGDTEVLVELNRTKPGTVIFEYVLQFDPNLTGQQRRLLEVAAANCPVKKTLSQTIEFALQQP